MAEGHQPIAGARKKGLEILIYNIRSTLLFSTECWGYQSIHAARIKSVEKALVTGIPWEEHGGIVYIKYTVYIAPINHTKNRV